MPQGGIEDFHNLLNVIKNMKIDRNSTRFQLMFVECELNIEYKDTLADPQKGRHN